jgi:hypothetical protein
MQPIRGSKRSAARAFAATGRGAAPLGLSTTTHTAEAGRLEGEQQAGLPDLRGRKARRSPAQAETADLRTGDIVLTHTRGVLDTFAICLHGPGSEGGMKTCYIKVGAARGGAGAGDRFDRLLDACDAFASSRGVPLEAGMNLAREDSFRRMRTHGYRTMTQGVAMLRPNLPSFNRPDVYVIDDWR